MTPWTSLSEFHLRRDGSFLLRLHHCADTVAVDLGSDRSLEQVHRYNDPQRFFLGADHKTLHSRQRAAIDTDPLPRLKIRPRYHHRIGGHQRPQIVEFRRADRCRRIANAEDLLDPRRLQYAHAVIQVKAAKQVSRKQRLVHDLGAVAPPAFDAAHGQVGLESPLCQFGGRKSFPPGRCPDGEPTWHSYLFTKSTRGFRIEICLNSVYTRVQPRTRKI